MSVVLIDFAVRCRKLSLEEITLSRFQVSVLWTFSCLFTWECLTLSVVSNSVVVPCRRLCITSVGILIALPWLPDLLRTFLESLPVLPTTRIVDASDTKTIGLVLTGVELIDFDSVTAEPSANFCSCPLFDMDLEFLKKSETIWLKWLRGNVYTVRRIFKPSKLFHTSSEKLPIVRISTSWFLVSTYLIWILEAQVIGSKNKSRAFLWVLDTCLMKGLLPFIIILITASLFSKMYNFESSSEECMLMDVLFRFLSDRKFLVSLTWLYCMFYFDSKIKCRKFIRNPASTDIIADSVQLWDVVDFESSRSPTKSESCSNPNRQYCVALPIWQNYRSSFVTWIYDRCLVNRLSHTWVHYLIARP